MKITGKFSNTELHHAIIQPAECNKYQSKTTHAGGTVA